MGVDRVKVIRSVFMAQSCFGIFLLVNRKFLTSLIALTYAANLPKRLR